MESCAETSRKCLLGTNFMFLQECLELVQSEQQRHSLRDRTVETLPDDSNQVEPNNRVQKDGDEQRDKDPRATEDDHAFNDLIRRLQGKLEKQQAYMESLKVPTPEACHQHPISYEECTNCLHQNKHSGSHRRMSPLTKEVKLEDDRKNMHSRSSFWCGFCRCMVPVGDTSDPRHIRAYHVGSHLIHQPGRELPEWLSEASDARPP